MKLTRFLQSLTILFVFSFWIPAFAVVIVGLPPDANSGNCYPFGCAYNGEYQQVYKSSTFTGPIIIRAIEFYNTSQNLNGTAMNSGTWAISLSTTSANWNTLSTVFASNTGADNTTVFTGNLTGPWSFGNTLRINLDTPYAYDPSRGNLLLDVIATGTTAVGGSISFDANGYNNGGYNGNTIMGRVFHHFGNPSGQVLLSYGYGLVTGFSSVGVVPEPASYILLGLGSLLIAAYRCRGVASGVCRFSANTQSAA